MYAPCRKAAYALFCSYLNRFKKNVYAGKPFYLFVSFLNSLIGDGRKHVLRVTYVLYAPCRKAAYALSCLQLASFYRVIELKAKQR